VLLSIYRVFCECSFCSVVSGCNILLVATKKGIKIFDKAFIGYHEYMGVL